MSVIRQPAGLGLALIFCGTTFIAQPAGALEPVEFIVAGDNAALAKDLRGASVLLAGESEGKSEPEEVFAAARAEYGRLVNTLYAKGHYAPVIRISVDGREAASIAPLDAPAQIGRIVVNVDPGPVFAFSQTRLRPVAPGTKLPEGFAPGEPAESGLVRAAVQAGVTGWRDAGHAKAAVSGQDVVADHVTHTLSADVTLNPGPKLRFGKLRVEGHQRMQERRILKIAGLPEGEVYSPEELKRSAERLRRSGVFRSVSMVEDETVTRPDLLGITATVVEEKTRRYSIGAEVASFEGLDLTGYWLHRNLLGGGERLKVEGEVANIGAQNSGMDYMLGVSVERPATLTADTTMTLKTGFAHLDEEDFTADLYSFGIGFSQYISDELTARAGLEYNHAEVEDAFDTYTYKHLALPLGVTWDKRDTALDARKGFYIDAEARPYLGFGTTDSGLRIKADGRIYKTFGEARPVTLAGRAQLGAIMGGSVLGTPRDYLFYSGGGGTVRGQPYQALGVPLTRAVYSEEIGGMTFAALSAELRARITPKIGVVGFADAGFVGVTDFGTGDWHAGAGLGLRYDTGFGPIRLDVATPIEGSVDTGDGVQIYVGIGQAF
ncbi:autotransporter assembly complex protein TamA [Gemmobacter denitrificans]|uniref:Autotransporter assembly complex family protein n=1 Tax=Gemmobacter denitrificans TaxID=3123040 RepID=A0ABU8BVF3_9RHOB